MIIEDTGLCALCGKRYAQEEHHLIFGTFGRSIADEDGITLPVCSICHRLAEKPLDRIHGNPMAERLSKFCGQLAWENDWIIKMSDLGPYARQRVEEAFRKRYGRLYL